MSKRRRKRDDAVQYDTHGDVDIEFTAELRDPSTVPYAPPPTEDAKWKASAAVGVMPKWNGTMKGVMTCLIQCANQRSGKCCPSEEWMAGKLKCTRRAIGKAISRIEKEFPKYLAVYHRSEPGAAKWECNGYVIGWKALINRCHGAFPWTDRRNECSDTGERTFQARGNERSRKEIEGEEIEGRNRRKTVHPPSAASTTFDVDSYLKEIIEGKQRTIKVANRVTLFYK
jgi:hypothetical protein